MATLLDAKPKKKDKGYHIRDLDTSTRHMAKVGAVLAGVKIGVWIARAIQEKFTRDVTNNRTGD